MAEEYMPTTEEVRTAWGYFGNDVENWEDVQHHESAHAEFDRWLAAHDREVRAEAWDEGYASRNPLRQPLRAVENPYREGSDG